MKNLKTIITIVVVAVLGFFGYWLNKDKNSEMSSENTDAMQTAENNGQMTTDKNTQVQTPDASVFSRLATKYKDGTYTVNTNYFASPGKEDMGVTLTIQNDKVIAVLVEKMATNRESVNYQNKFISGVSSAVVGQTIDSLKLSVVSGASLTTGGFNAALNQIRSQAKI